MIVDFLKNVLLVIGDILRDAFFYFLHFITFTPFSLDYGDKSIYYDHANWINFCMVLFFVLELLNFSVAYLFKLYIKKKSPIYRDIQKVNNDYPFYDTPKHMIYRKQLSKSVTFADYAIDKYAKEQFRDKGSPLSRDFEAATLNRFQLNSYVYALTKIKHPTCTSDWPPLLKRLFEGYEKEIYTRALSYPNINPTYCVIIRLDTPGGRIHRKKDSWCDQAYMEKLYKIAHNIPITTPMSTIEALLWQEEPGEVPEGANDYAYMGNRHRRGQAYYQTGSQQSNSAISPRMRYEVLTRDNHCCIRCGKTAADGATLDVYFKIPLAKGGRPIKSNLCTLCESCAMEMNVPRKTAKVRRVQYVSDEFKKEQRARMTPKYKESIKRRDGYRCQICGKGLQDGVKLEVDHIKPVALGGTSDPGNLRTLCWECNHGKGAMYDPDGLN